MMTNEKLIELSRNVDSYISQLAVKYDISPLSLSAVIVARCMAFNNEAESTEDFLKLLASIITNPPMKNETQVH